MSSVNLSASVRQNLLSLQDTAALTATNQYRLSTGKKVNSALDNPTNFFTSQTLSSRSSDLRGLLDGISNGVQAIQAANQGITSIQKLIDSAKSITSQALASKNTVSSSASSSGTASTAYAAPTATTAVTFTIGGGAALTASLAVGDTIDQAIAKLNTAAGSAIFGKDLGGTKLTLSSPNGQVAFTAGQTATGFANADIVNVAAGAGGIDATRTSLATQFNSLLTQIDQLAKDASFNGVNLISSAATTNKLHISFNEKDSSNLDVQGVDLTSAGLGLTTALSSGNFQTDTELNSLVTKLNTATSSLRAQASTFGSNLSVVQNRQDFSKQLINVLDIGSSNLTSADLNEEAANSQALTTRQSLGISALSLANQAQQSILQLLR